MAITLGLDDRRSSPDTRDALGVRVLDPIVRCVIWFRQQGYSATGVADIAETARAPKGSLYHYFPGGKRAIAAAAVTLAGQRVERTLQQIADRTQGTAELLIEHARLLGSWLAESRYRDGCPITSVLLELAPEERAVIVAGGIPMSGAWQFFARD